MKPACLIALLFAATGFVGTQAAASPQSCESCHLAQTAKFAHAGMTIALETGQDSAVLQANPKLTAKIGAYSYEILRSGDHSIYTVTDGKETIRIPIEWAFGKGTVGQTYVYQRDGHWYESHVSYFNQLKGLDVTIGQQDIVPHSLLEAAGRLSSPPEVRDCFDCHATNVKRSLPLDLSSMRIGIQCERCHGASEQHLQTQSPMRKLGDLTTEEMSDFCGQCHRTWSQIAASGPHGIQNIRFQPYRLANSKCYDAADNRIRCTTCHDPHTGLETSPAAYDSKCLACHSIKASHPVCRVSTKNCATCHMPQLELPGSHHKFTDHRIRVVKANETYPD